MSGENTPVSQLTKGELIELISGVSKEAVREGIKGIDDSVKEVVNSITKLHQENANLKSELEQLKKDRIQDRQEISMLQDQMKKKNIIFKGIPSSNELNQTINKVCGENLKLENTPNIKSSKKIYDRNGKMGVLVELDSESEVHSILHKSRNLAGSSISIEKDISKYRQEDKRVMIQLKRDIGNIDKTQRLQVRDDRLRVGNQWFKWNSEKTLTCGKENGEHVLRGIYGNKIDNLDLRYQNIENKLKNKNINN